MTRPSSPPEAVAMDELDATIRQLEAERTSAQQRRAVAHGAEAESLAVALAGLDAKLSEAEGLREQLARRRSAAERMQQIAAEMRALRIELEALASAGDRGERFEELRRRAHALHAEAQLLQAEDDA